MFQLSSIELTFIELLELPTRLLCRELVPLTTYKLLQASFLLD